MKKRILSALLALTLCLSLLPTAAFAENEAETETTPTVVNIFDGKITKGELWTALKCSSTNIAAYHYCQIDKDGKQLTGWKRLNTDSDQNSSAIAELIEDQTLYKLESITKFNDSTLGDFFGGKWDPVGTFQIQNYHKITIDSSALTTGSVTVDGATLAASYDVKAGSSLKLDFTDASGFVPQVKLGTGMWCTVTDNTYTVTPKISSTLAVRYAAAPDAGSKKLAVTVNDEALGRYSVTGAETDHVTARTSVTLTVTPYNSSTTPDNDRWAYVKSVKVNGTELADGAYNNTVFTGKFTVTEDTEVEIEFAPRLVLKAPDYLEHKYEQDPKINMYTAKMNMDKKVSEQDDAIVQSILNSTVDTGKSSEYSDAKVLLKAVVERYSNDPLYYDIRENVTLKKTEFWTTITVFDGHWGDQSFHNYSLTEFEYEKWEEIQLELPATADRRYPAVRTEDLTVWILEVRPELKIEGTAAETTVESDANLKAAIEAAALSKMLDNNPGVTLDKIGAGNITYSYTAPAFDKLSSETANNVEVKVTVSKSDNYLKSSGTITVPVLKASTKPKVTVNTDGNGTATYTVNGNQYTLTLTPNSGYYVKELEIVDAPNGETGTTETKTLAAMTAYKDGKYSYQYVRNAEESHSYILTARFVEYKLTATAASTEFPYYDGMCDSAAAAETALKTKVTVSNHATFPTGILYLEYNAGSGTWLTIGAELPDDENSRYHAFGEQTSETIRYRYVFTTDGFAVTSNEVTLTLTDSRTETEIKTKDKKTTFELSYAELAAKTSTADKASFLLEKLLDGVYVTGENEQKLEDATVTVSPAADTLETGSNSVTLQYAGNATYKPSAKNITLTLTGTEATVKVTASPTTVVYGGTYDVSVTTKPENLQTIQFAIGLDLTKISVEKKLVPVSVTILGPEKLRKVLLTCTDESGALTVYSLAEGIEALLADEASYEKTGVSKAALNQLLLMLSYSSHSTTTPAIVGNEWPKEVGFYVVGAIAADPSIASNGELGAPMSVDYLSITPQHINATLGWKNELTDNSVKKEGLTAAYMAAEVKSVADGGKKEDAAQLLQWFYLGLDDEEHTLKLYSENEFKSGAVYTQVAFLMEQEVEHLNTVYASVPIQREFAVDAAYANVQFVDNETDKKPVDVYFYEIPTGQETVTVSAPVMVDDEPVTEGLTRSYQSLYVTSNATGAENSGLPDGSGFYLLHAGYQKTGDDGKVTAAGKDSALLVISGAIEGFTPQDTTVTYNGEERFISIDGAKANEIPYLSVIVDTTNKAVNILLPNGMSLEDILGNDDVLDSLSGLGEILWYLRLYSSASAQAKALEALLTQVAADIKDTTGWTASINAAKPKNVGTYPVYLMTITDGGLYLGKRTLTITPKAITAVITVDEKTYDGSTDATIHVAFKKDDLCGDDSITVTGLTGAFNTAGASADSKTVTIHGTAVITGNELGNYTIRIPETAEGTIKAAQITVVTLPTGKTGLTHNSQPQELIAAGTASSGTMQYKVDDGEWSADIPTATNAGTFTVHYKGVGGSTNYIDSTPASFNVMIAPAQLTVKADSKSVLVGAAMPEWTYTVSGLFGSDTLSTEPTMTCTAVDTKTAGTYAITASGAAASNNYAIVYEAGTLTVSHPSSGASSYQIVLESTGSGTVKSSHRTAEAGETVTLTVTPNKSHTLTSLTALDKKGKEIALTDKGSGKYTFKMPASKVTVKAVFTAVEKTGFTDVPGDAYFADAVDWATENGITGGTDAAHFSPYASCTRGQLVAFLWRAIGKPEVANSENPFTDVKSGPFYQAILWAVEKGIVTGYSDGTFRPNQAVTRQQVAAILWRYAKHAGMDVSVGADTNILSFNDAPSVSEYAVPAIQWAVGAGIMQGNGGYLLPHNTCTRAQIVTFLYRLLGN